MNKIQVFDWLKMPGEWRDDFSEYFEAGNDSYHRWYPQPGWCANENLASKVNSWLDFNGMEIDPSDKHFFVLVHVSW